MADSGVRRVRSILWIVVVACAVLASALPVPQGLAQSTRPTPRGKTPPQPVAPAPTKKAPDPKPAKPPPAAEKPKPAPPMSQPRRAMRTPVDVKDVDACCRELADLASMTGNSKGEGTEPAVGWYPYPSAEVALDRVVRFDHLMSSPDERVRALAAKVRAIVFDNTAVNRFEEIYGSTFEARQAEMSKRLWSQLRSIGATIIDYERPRTEMYRYTDSGGNAREISVVRDNDYSLSADAEAAHARYVRELAAASLEREEVSRACNAAREQLADELLVIWNRDLLPGVAKKNGTPISLSLGEDYERGPQYNGTFLSDDVWVQVESEKPVHNAVLMIEVVDEFGLRVTNRYFLPAIAAKTKWNVPAFGRHSNWLGHSVGARLDVTVNCDEGSWSAKDQSFPPNGGGSAAVERLGEAKRKQLREKCEKEDADLAAKGTALLRIARERFAPPPNPDAARAQLKSSLRTGIDYKASFERGGEKYSATLTLDSIDDSTGLFLGRATYSCPTWKEDISTRMRGRLTEEMARGCVLAFRNYKDGPVDESDLPPPPKIPQSKLDRMTPEQRQQMEERFESIRKSGRDHANEKREAEAKAWAAGDVWLITSPVEIALLDRDPPTAGDFLAGSNGLRGGHQYGLAVKAARAKQAVNAEMVLFLDKDGKLMMQNVPDATERTVSWSPVTKSP